MAHPAFENDERCRDPRPEGATIVSIFRVPNAQTKPTLAQPPASPEDEPVRIPRAANSRG